MKEKELQYATKTTLKVHVDHVELFTANSFGKR